jgi:DNA gyrase/topoisomerase IV subunit A
MFRFQDGEAIVRAFVSKNREGEGLFPDDEFLIFTERGLGFRTKLDLFTETKRTGRRIAKVGDSDKIGGIERVKKQMVLFLSREGYGLCVLLSEIPFLGSAGKGVILQKMSKGDKLAAVCFVGKDSKVPVRTRKGTVRTVDVSAMTISERARRGDKVINRDGGVEGLEKTKASEKEK